MSRATEKYFKELEKFMADKEFTTDEEYEQLLDEFTAQYNDSLQEDREPTADDYLEMAEEADSAEESLSYVRKALAVEPGNLDAQLQEAMLTARNADGLLNKMERMINRAEKTMNKQGYFMPDSAGDFWGIIETRPYMRLIGHYAIILYRCGKLRAAKAVMQKIIRLNHNDNLGMRYRLIHLYTFLEEEESALALTGHFSEENTQFLLCLSLLYYKKGDLKKAEEYLRRLQNLNQYTKHFIELFLNGGREELSKCLLSQNYEANSLEELCFEFSENDLLLHETIFLEWCSRKLRSRKK